MMSFPSAFMKRRRKQKVSIADQALVFVFQVEVSLELYVL